MYSGIGFSHMSPQGSEPLPVRLSSLQKLGRFFGIAGKLGRNGHGKIMNGRTASLNRGEVTSRFLKPSFPTPGPAAAVDSPKTSHETVRPRKHTDSGRTLHHSISTPSFRPKHGCPRRASGEEVLSSKPSVPVVISLFKELQPSISQRRKHKPKPLSATSNSSLTAVGTEDIAPPSPSKRKKRSTEKLPSRLIPDNANVSPNSKHRFSTMPRHSTALPSTESLEFATSPSSPEFYPSYAGGVCLRSMTSVDSTATTSEAHLYLSEERPTRRHSLDKRRRVLGNCPSNPDSDGSTGEFGELSSPGSPSPSEKAFSLGGTGNDDSPVNAGKAKVARRMSLTLSSLTAIPARLRPPTHVRRPSATSPPAFNNPFRSGKTPDSISEAASNDMRDDSYSNASSPSLISPIAFIPDPPSPVCPLPSSHLAMSSNLTNSTGINTNTNANAANNPSLDKPIFPFDLPPPSSPSSGDSQAPAPPSKPSSLPVPRLLRSARPRSLSLAPSRKISPQSSRLWSAGPTPTSVEHRGDGLGADLPVKANWLHGAQLAIFSRQRERERERERERAELEKEEREKEAALRKSSVPEWSGQWNEDDMDKVIKKLRSLR